MALKRQFNQFDRMEFPAYKFNEFPKAMYKKADPKVLMKTAANADEVKALTGEGYTTHPSGVAPKPAAPVKPLAT